uniref:TFIIS N-terminal domain-containing protein n=1 Tax=Peronospora matthiolae TaxID=2874970 RepID=A0AAV1TRN4_9STRA
MTAVVPNSVGWYILEGYPWWPVYICDVTKLRPTLHLLGSGHKKILKKARDFPLDFIVVYYFGSHDFSLVGMKNGVLRPWDCAQKDQFLKGHPKHLTKKKGVIEDLRVAVHEAEEFLSQPEDIRLPPHMVPSDLDPTLEPPPELVVPVDMAMNSDTDEEMETRSVDDGDDMENGDHEEEVQVMKHKKKKKEKKEKKTKKKKKGPEEEKTKRTDDIKRKNDSEKGRDTRSASPVKVAKTMLETDVKSERHVVKRDNDEKKWPPPAITSEALSILLEKEIRWILVNCPFEEMTTRMVRKLLEERLKIDLRHHKASIKEGVARVIASMEDEDTFDSVSTAPEEGAAALSEDTAQPDLKVEQDRVAMPISPGVVVKTEMDVAREKEVADAASNESTRKELEAVSKHLSLALELEPKILDALNLLKSIDHVDKNVLAASSLQPRLVKLRVHPSSRICELITNLVKKWDVEDLVPAPEPITKEEILDLKTQLEYSETSHDELLVCLNRLSEMPLTIDHLKKTGIARAVSNLRQHGNDKVSAKAHDLRQKWIKLSNEQPAESESGSNSLKTLQTLNRILGQQSDGTDEQKHQRKQLAALEQLQSMSLDTKDIIDSKVGIPVSKLRNSSNEKVAKLAIKLRKKWQAEAKA